MLKDTAFHRVPRLKGTSVVRTYAGLRPATTERDYQFHVDAARQFVSVASIRSTGLTASLGIGRAIATLITSSFDWITTIPEKVVHFTQFPDVKDMAKDYREAGDGTVAIPIIGRRRVTDPVTQVGWGLNT